MWNNVKKNSQKGRERDGIKVTIGEIKKKIKRERIEEIAMVRCGIIGRRAKKEIEWLEKE